jgi:hypothetical protein
MFDVEQRRRISAEELRDLLVGGENFEAETEETGRDCTVEVLRTVMGGGTLDPLSGQSGLPIPNLGALGAVSDLMGLARRAGDRFDDRDDRWDRDPRRDDRRDERRRPRHRSRPSLDWAEGESDSFAGLPADEGSA